MLFIRRSATITYILGELCRIKPPATQTLPKQPCTGLIFFPIILEDYPVRYKSRTRQPGITFRIIEGLGRGTRPERTLSQLTPNCSAFTHPAATEASPTTGVSSAKFCFKAEEFLPNTAPKVQENPQALVKKLLQQAIHDKHLEADYPTLSAFTEWDDPCAIGRALAPTQGRITANGSFMLAIAGTEFRFLLFDGALGNPACQASPGGIQK